MKRTSSLFGLVLMLFVTVQTAHSQNSTAIEALRIKKTLPQSVQQTIQAKEQSFQMDIYELRRMNEQRIVYVTQNYYHSGMLDRSFYGLSDSVLNKASTSHLKVLTYIDGLISEYKEVVTRLDPSSDAIAIKIYQQIMTDLELGRSETESVYRNSLQAAKKVQTEFEKKEEEFVKKVFCQDAGICN